MHITPGAGVSGDHRYWSVSFSQAKKQKLWETFHTPLRQPWPQQMTPINHPSCGFLILSGFPGSCALESPSSSTTSTHCVSEFIFRRAKTKRTLTSEDCSKHKLDLVYNAKNIWPRAWYPLPQPLLTLCLLWGPGPRSRAHGQPVLLWGPSSPCWNLTCPWTPFSDLLSGWNT